MPETRYDFFDNYYYQTKIGKPKNHQDRVEQIILIKKLIQKVIISIIN